MSSSSFETELVETSNGRMRVTRGPLHRYLAKHSGQSPARQRRWFADGTHAVRGLRRSWTWDLIGTDGFLAQDLTDGQLAEHARRAGGDADRYTMPSRTDD